MQWLRRVIRTWTFWYFLLPAFVLPPLLLAERSGWRLDDLLLVAAGSLTVQAVPPLFFLSWLFETQEPLWVVEIVLIAWAFLAGFAADFVTGRVRERRARTSG